MMKDQDWKTLSIARNKSDEFNSQMKTKFNGDYIASNSSPICYQNSQEVRDEFKK